MNKIRQANFDDCVDILNVYNDANKRLGYPEQNILSTFEDMVKNNLTFVLIDEEKIIAFISAKINVNSAFLSAMYVIYEKQHNGLGGKLLKFIEEKLSKNGVELITLKALKEQIISIHFYEKYQYLKYDENTEIKNSLQAYLPIKQYEYLMYKKL